MECPLVADVLPLIAGFGLDARGHGKKRAEAAAETDEARPYSVSLAMRTAFVLTLHADHMVEQCRSTTAPPRLPPAASLAFLPTVFADEFLHFFSRSANPAQHGYADRRPAVALRGQPSMETKLVDDFSLDARLSVEMRFGPDAMETSKVAAAIRGIDVASTSSGALPPISSNDGFRWRQASGGLDRSPGHVAKYWRGGA
uniref:hypothetical protein n=1 Tax=Mesorhizobium sp. WSM4875 TaxID=3038539 RepID=UPI002416502A|nr:hypothetical protein [Mesorhizobium sp. WSM4875]WIE94799.1 hypothetical protein P9270_030195 [Mesorhizobium sp. WSM4875]